MQQVLDFLAFKLLTTYR